MVVTTFGLGFVGITLSLGLADTGHTIFGYDTDPHKIDALKAGKIPFEEPGLDKLLERQLHRNFHLINSEELGEAIKKSDCVFYCVGTPSDDEGRVDLGSLRQALLTTLKHKPENKHLDLIIKSTIPPGTCRDEIIPYLENAGYMKGRDFDLAHNPEFLREGHSLSDFMNADKIVIGADNEKVFDKVKTVYSGISSSVFEVSITTAEFIKYLSNTFLATLISFSNEMAYGAESIGDVDIAKAFKILHTDKRWEGSGITEYIYPGCGYGGYCLPKDTKGLYYKFLDHNCRPGILEEVINRNDAMAELSVKKICRECNNAKDTKIGVLGLSFKPGSDDVRESPSAKLIKELNGQGYYNINAYDPVANENFKRSYPSLAVKTYESISEIERESDLLVIVTAWPQFKDIHKITGKPIVNLRYIEL